MTTSSSSSLLHLLPTNVRRRTIQNLDSSDREWLRRQENQLYLLLYYSYLEARKGGKRKTHDEHLFEINAHKNLLLAVPRTSLKIPSYAKFSPLPFVIVSSTILSLTPFTNGGIIILSTIHILAD